jgi:hypothetical protein
LSEKLGYDCGPSGVAPSEDGEYIVRPIYNLSGMGVGARVQIILAGDQQGVEAGYFWCERFLGRQLSVCYYNREPYSVYEGHRYPTDPLYKFDKWVKRDLSEAPQLTVDFDELDDVEYLNVEYVDGNIIEVHLRGSPDPEYDEIIPVWFDDEIESLEGYRWIDSYDNADGLLPCARRGFFVK